MDLQTIQNTTRTKMQKALEHLKEELSGVRTGRANPALLESIKVEAYGTKMDLRDLASINAPEPRLLVIQVWDQGNAAGIEKGIRDSNLGLNPATEGNLIRVPIPPLTEERRKEMTKTINEKSEAARVSIRQIRREAVEAIDKAEKSKEISEDEKFRSSEAIQKITEELTVEVEKFSKMKENEILQI